MLPDPGSHLQRKACNMLLVLLAVVFTCFSAGTNRAFAQEQKTKVIYFLSGIRDHASPTVGGRHDVARDMLVLQRCLDSVANIKGVKIVTKYLAERSALNIEDLKDVDAVIIECSSVSGSQKRTHPLLPPLPADAKTYDKATMAYLDQIDSLQAAGMGIMILHWGIATEKNPPATARYMKWFGQTSLEVYTQNPLGFWKVSPVKGSENHPILRGVNPWVYKDEIFSRMVGNPGDPYRTDLLMGESPASNMGVIAPRGIASAYEKGKARGILWGGMDFHSALLNENYLRFIMNEIVWVAGIEVPKGGVKTNAKGLQMTGINTSFDNLKPADLVLK